MSDLIALAAARVFDGDSWHEDAAALVRDGRIVSVEPRASLPADVPLQDLGPGLLAPGFVDLQVNGGGGVMLNDRPDADTIETICRAHQPFGTTALLPTLITDTPEVTARAIEAGTEAARRGVPGFIGLHLEGPHLAVGRKGAHDPALIRPMTDDDLALLVEAAKRLPALLVTVAVESVQPKQVAELVAAGITVSLGHSDATAEQAQAHARSGASMVTHLFNAMSQIGSREPGLAGAALELGALGAGLIADGFHVHPSTIGIALRAKRGPGRIFLVTDAMATVGSDLASFTLNGRTIYRAGGRLTLADGTLAGADLDMISAVRFMHRTVGVELGEALRMASLYPSQALGLAPGHGTLSPGSRADIVHLTDELAVGAVWIGGRQVASGN